MARKAPKEELEEVTDKIEEQVAPPEEPTVADETTEESIEEQSERTYKDWREALADADFDELFKDDRIAGRIGQQADRLARQRIQEDSERDQRSKTEEANRKDQEYLRQLRKTDFDAYNREMDKRESQADYTRREIERNREIAGAFTQRLDEWAQTRFPKDVLAKYANKTYEGSFIEGVIGYLGDLNDEYLSVQRKEIERDLKPALKKQLLTELNGGETPGSEQSAKGKAKDNQDFNTELECATAFLNGEISREKMLEIYRKHPGWR